jgi:transposase-like protein
MSASRPAESKSQPGETKRRQWSDQERDLIVRASLKKGATVSAVARLYGLQAWQIYEWRKRARQLAVQSKRPTLIPVRVTEPDHAENVDTKQSCSLLIEAQGARITISGRIDAVVVRTVLECLAR